MSQAKYGTTVRVPHPIYERASKAAKECGLPVGSFITDALEDVLAGLEAEAAILPRCIAKRAAHGSNPVVEKATKRTADALHERFGKFSRKLAVDDIPVKKKPKSKKLDNVNLLEREGE